MFKYHNSKRKNVIRFIGGVKKMEDEIYQQMSLWDYIYPKKIIDKPIRLIEFFAGIGAQYKALKQITNDVERIKEDE